MKTFKEIISNEYFSVSGFIKDDRKYWAHLGNDGEPPETLEEHVKLVLEYFMKLIESNGLEPIIDNLIIQFLSKNGVTKDTATEDLMKEMFAGVVLFHDFGKINPAFQTDKMKNQQFGNGNTILGSKHSLIGACMLIAYYYKVATERGVLNLDKNPPDGLPFLFILLGLAYPIRQHHGQLFTVFDSSPFNADELSEIKNLSGKLLPNLSEVYDVLNFLFQENNYKNLTSHPDFANSGNIAGYLLIKLSFSLLTAADYYATNQYMSGIKWDDFGVLNRELKDKFTNNLHSISYNKNLFQNKEGILKQSIDDLSEFSNENLNLLRSHLAFEVLTNLQNNLDNRLFYLEAPTGGGKTNLSFLAISELLGKDETINKVFYVFPFTTLITQTLSSITKDIGFTDGEVAQIHSKSGISSKHASNDLSDDEFYGKEKLNYLTGYFYNYPILLTSHVRFFDLMLSHRKDKNYGLHRLANSVVVIDEIQSYNPDIWEKLIFVVKEYAELLNIRFIIMSATLPKISKLLRLQTDPFVDLISNKEGYFKNPNFSGRVKYDFSLTQNSPFELDGFIADVSKIVNSELKARPDLRVLIEFVTKKAANEFYSLISTDTRYNSFPNKFLLSGSILEPRRKELIARLKGGIRDTSVTPRWVVEPVEGPVIVVATQVIEAGVDIDMDIGFKDMAMPDADEQFAGRVNRNATKKGCKVYLFNSGMANAVYRRDRRLEVVKKYLSREEYKEILNSKNFERMYDIVLDRISKENQLNFAEGFQSFKDDFQKANFQKIDKAFGLIEDNSIQVFIPVNINLALLEKKEQQTAGLLNLINNDKTVSGERLFSKYRNALSTKDDDFVKKSTIIKNINALMANFTINVFQFGEEFNSIKNFGDFCGDVFYLEFHQNIYSYEDGIGGNDTAENDASNFL